VKAKNHLHRAGFTYNGKTTKVSATHATDATGHPIAVRTYVNEFWTSQQRAGNGLQQPHW
jgi:hypothetical protein